MENKGFWRTIRSWVIWFIAFKEWDLVEQNCVYLDLDGKDEVALHLIGEYEGEIVAHARLLNQELVLITLLLVEWL
jgi:hypothetical protein